MKIDDFTNLYSLSKTLRFKLVPIGNTEENFNAKGMLKDDKERAEDYAVVKKYIDEIHKEFIGKVLSDPKLTVNMLDDLRGYAAIYGKTEKDDKDKKGLAEHTENLRKIIFEAFKENKKDLLSNKALVESRLPDFINNSKNTEKLDKADGGLPLDEKIKLVKKFKHFSTYFNGFNENRENMYKADGSTAISYRCINDNLPKFLDNIRIFEKVRGKLTEELSFISRDFENYEDIFSVDYFCFVLSQDGIDKYNNILGGYTKESGEKIQGINEYIYHYNQKNKTRLPKMKRLWGQILGDKTSFSFAAKPFESKDELTEAVKEYMGGLLLKDMNDKNVFDRAKALFNNMTEYDMSKIYISQKSVNNVSQRVFGEWHILSDGWKEEYAKSHKKPKAKKGEEEDISEWLDNAFKKNSAYSAEELLDCIPSENDAEKAADYEKHFAQFRKYYGDKISGLAEIISDKYNKFASLEFSDDKKLNDNEIVILKELLDGVKAFEDEMKPFCSHGGIIDIDDKFYGELTELYDAVAQIDRLYDRVRNFATQKPYSTDKIKLNFDNPQFLGGWDKNKEKDYRCVLLSQNGNYFLAVMDKSNNKIFEKYDCDLPVKGSSYKKINYKLLPDPNKMLPKVFFARSNIDYYAPSREILDIYNSGKFKTGASFNIDDCHKLIDFYKQSIDKHKNWSKFGFKFKETSEYNGINEFYRDVEIQGYAISFSEISEDYINDKINSGELYLFRIYNKDFSEYSKGTPNMHTLYFKMLFSPENLRNTVYELNGQSEMFYRLASVSYDEEKMKKGFHYDKLKNKFNYPIIKDRRFTQPQFSIHIPITINFKAKGQKNINSIVRNELKKSSVTNIIGIDRGERNLLHICVIDGSGKIIEQRSLNTICTEYNGKIFENDYHKQLDAKEKERKEARKSWQAVENIKYLKSGYLSYAVHEIAKLVVKYDALIGLEDLNQGFKNIRGGIEKSVYQKFEKALTDKLSYLADKTKDVNAKGGLLNAYQLVCDKSNDNKQNGIIFYIPAYLTSKIDPVTGFTNQFVNLRYESIVKSQDFFKNFESIVFNKAENIYEFAFDYKNFGAFSGRWVVCSNGERILSFRNRDNNSWDTKTVILTDEFSKLFDEYGIDPAADVLAQICKQNEKKFFERLINLFKLTLQMRNSKPNTDIDYLISPVKDKKGKFYDSREYARYEDPNHAPLPNCADANGAYNIARKVQWAVEQIKSSEQPDKAKTCISKKEWLEYAKESNK